MQGMQVQPLVWEDSTSHGATEPMHHNYWSPGALEARLHNKPLQWEASTTQPRVASLTATREKPSGHKEDPVQLIHKLSNLI